MALALTTTCLTKNNYIRAGALALDIALLATAVALAILYKIAALGLCVGMVHVLAIVVTKIASCYKNNSRTVQNPIFPIRIGDPFNKIVHTEARKTLQAIAKDMNEVLMTKVLEHIEWAVQKFSDDKIGMYNLEQFLIVENTPKEKKELTVKTLAETLVINTLKNIMTTKGIPFYAAVYEFIRIREKTEEILNKSEELKNRPLEERIGYPERFVEASEQANQIIFHAYQIFLRTEDLTLKDAILQSNLMESEARLFNTEYQLLDIQEFKYKFRMLAMRNLLMNEGMEKKSAEVVAILFIQLQKKKNEAKETFYLEDAIEEGKSIEEEFRFLEPLYPFEVGLAIILGGAKDCKRLSQKMITEEGLTPSCAKIRARTVKAIFLLNLQENRANVSDMDYAIALEQRWRDLSNATDQELCDRTCATIKARLENSPSENSSLNDLFNKALLEVPYQRT